MQRPYVVAITGGSGVLYAVRLVQVLVESGHRVSLVISDAARLVIREELGVTFQNLSRAEDLRQVFGIDLTDNLEVFSPKDFTAPIASGSYPTSGMVVIPCSMGTLGAIANGISQNLIHRAADCIIKEGKRLVIVPRETPLNAIHLENMLKLSRLGVRVVPAMPGFYAGAQSLDQLVDFMVGKVLDQLDIQHVMYPRWTGSQYRHHEKLENQKKHD